MNRINFNNYLRQNDFVNFFNELGWNHVAKSDKINPIIIDQFNFDITPVADKQGFKALVCFTDEFPQQSVRKKLDMQLRKYFHYYILIFVKQHSEHQLWMIPVKTIEKRDLVTLEYASADKADFLFSKLHDFSFSLEEDTNIIDVTARVHKAFEINSEKITKDFYTGFRKQHNSFVNFVQGIPDDADRKWFSSVMLNRLMFCYFIQKKGFLNFDPDYLRHKLQWTKQQQGVDQFYGTFYKAFLTHLFFGGLNAPHHDTDFQNVFGRIPYLNGGLFDRHQLENKYDIDIPDKVFEELFDFFDKWQWHLDTRITASGKDINPDVLGYIFEQYINDRAQMGAYYTKEDITEYIGKNCILPFLMDETAKTDSKKHFTPGGYVWQFLSQSGDKYIYDAVKKGMNIPNIPPEIAIGLDTAQPDLLRRRSEWNKPTPEPYALPTEIWRETIERRLRYADLLRKIRNGEIVQINDFITYNLDIRTFVEDVLNTIPDHLFIKHFYAALQNVSILDPTCGSGAFLFAALNILEPLYEICISRMQEFNAQNPFWFKEELAEIDNKYRSNIQYFIYKSIILRNLYGVDIMHEATEIARLRLFLKMVAVVDVDRRDENLGLDPLPDIDFNIRCGNTLIGYATHQQLDKDLVEGDMFANQEFRSRIEEEMEKVSNAFSRFKSIQLTNGDDMLSFKRAKTDLNSRLALLNDELNHRLYAATAAGSILAYDDWLASYQPFHWLAEFYEIIQHKGGFDVIIGNPPYVEYAKVSNIYKINNFKTEKSGNLFAFIMERVVSILKRNGYFSFIILMASITTQRMSYLRNLLLNNFKNNYFINLAGDWHPGKLFEGVRSQFTIYTGNNIGKETKVYTSNYIRWFNSERNNLMISKFSYIQNSFISKYDVFPKFGKTFDANIWCKVEQDNVPLIDYFKTTGKELLYRNAGIAYYLIAINFSQSFTINGINYKSSTLKSIFTEDYKYRDSLIAILNSNLFAWYYFCFSDCYHLTKKDFSRFFIKIDNILINKLSPLTSELMNSINQNSILKKTIYKTKGEIIYQEFYPRFSKPIIDEIDKVLAQHYGFTEEELDFIINYDIKYRMGSELSDNDNEEDETE
ncbi:MAG TPA: SAM-dependent methyltransferase [Dysgonamonadaceae bacterium]|nr:SAM-dependent methyltransferase [Dysgonamonadaceae bacterium]